MEALQVQGEFLFQFTSFSNWVNKASSKLSGYKHKHHIVCMDMDGKVCHIGEDFQKASFPVKVYSLQRVANS